MLTPLLTLVAAIDVLLAVVWLCQRRLIYFPRSQDVPPVASVVPGAEEISFDTPDGLRLSGWFAPSTATVAGATVLVFNGNAGDRSFRAPLAAALNQAGLSVLLFNYRGYGRNPGSPSEKGLVTDARTARAYAAARDKVDVGRLVYFGESLGAALALEHPPAALVLRSPFPQDQSRRLFDAAQEPKRFVLIRGANHNDFELLAGGQLLDEVTRFVGDVLTLSGNSDKPAAGPEGTELSVSDQVATHGASVA
jgi:fermentation-respiration switch protein FrsA (DUF1100 family)